MRLTSGSELDELNKDRLETRSLSSWLWFAKGIRESTVDSSGKSLESRLSGRLLDCDDQWHFIPPRTAAAGC